MNDEERKAFLKKFGYAGSCLNNELTGKKKADKKDTRVDKSELVSLARKFNVHPGGQRKQETLNEFLDKEAPND